ncbi:MAG TPA: type 1 glutamine amidotransferase domain-containing protein [Oleiagrimonas sp.]|nr:type 1 glutamine amidotransferase domain-containing protein [Oleiagrimonas sp.]
MSKPIKGRCIAIIATDGIEQSELETPRDVLRDAGARVDVIAPRKHPIQGFRHRDKGQLVEVDAVIRDVDCIDYDALVIPGGLFNPDELRTDSDILDFTRAFFDACKPVAAVCHGPWVLINAGVVKDRRMTSVPSIRQDLQNAGAHWVDEEVVVDRGLITSRTPDDLDAFCSAIIKTLTEDQDVDA